MNRPQHTLFSYSNPPTSLCMNRPQHISLLTHPLPPLFSFVNRNVPFDATEDALDDCFSQFGDVEYARIVMDKTTNKSRGLFSLTFTRSWHTHKSYSHPPPFLPPTHTHSFHKGTAFVKFKNAADATSCLDNTQAVCCDEHTHTPLHSHTQRVRLHWCLTSANCWCLLLCLAMTLQNSQR